MLKLLEACKLQNTLETILFFDGHCNLCNSFVDGLIRWAPEANFFFSSLQSETAKQLLPEHLRNEHDLGSVVFYEGGRITTQSTAAIRVLMACGGFWRAMAVFLIVPKFVRDFVYRWVARNRYRWFGRRSTCRWPTPDEAKRFRP